MIGIEALRILKSYIASTEAKLCVATLTLDRLDPLVSSHESLEGSLAFSSSCIILCSIGPQSCCLYKGRHLCIIFAAIFSIILTSFQHTPENKYVP